MRAFIVRAIREAAEFFASREKLADSLANFGGSYDAVKGGANL